jgi:helicase
VPLKALAEEKFREFLAKYSDWGLTIAISTSERSEFDEVLRDFDLVIATYEKLNALLVRDKRVCADMGVVVVDEVQYIGDPGRGPVLEMLLTRLKSTEVDKTPQIIGLSATAPNASEISEWLQAKLIETTKRDVDLREGILYLGANEIEFNGKKLNKNDLLFREFNSGLVSVEHDCRIIEPLVLAQMCDKSQMIIFEQTRGDAERRAIELATVFPLATKAMTLINELDTTVEPTSISRSLKRCIQNGTAFHHAGLLFEERQIVEEGFRNGIIRIICSTPTLGAGVNTPAKYVIIRSYRLWDSTKIPTREYKNMSGRAGRIQYHDDYGESILLASTEKELRMLWNNYVTAAPEKISSQMSAKGSIDLPIIQIVASGDCTSLDEVQDFLTKTLFGYTYFQKANEKLGPAFLETIKKRIENLAGSGFFKITNGSVTITELGKRCAVELLSPESVTLLFSCFGAIQKRIDTSKNYEELLEGILHLMCCTQDARRSGALLYLSFSRQETKELRDYWEYNKSKFLYVLDDEDLNLRALKTTQMLLRWIEGAPYPKLSAYAPAGQIKRIAESISWVLSATAGLIEKPLLNLPSGFVNYLVKLSQTVYYGVPDETVKLMQLRIPAVQRSRALSLSKSGYNTLNALVETPIETLEKVSGIGGLAIATGIKKYVENYIQDANKRHHQSQVRRAKELGRDPALIDKLYTEIGDDFSKACVGALTQVGIDAKFIGDLSPHEVDILMETDAGKIVAECKRKTVELVGAKEAEEILGEGAKHKPVAHVTFGFPDFSKDAITNAPKAHVTLIPHSILGELLIGFWSNKVETGRVLAILRSEVYVDNIA